MEVLFLAVFGFIIILRSFHTLQSVKTPKQRAGKRVHRHLLIMPKTTYCSLTWTTSPINKTKRFFKSLISSKISFSKKILKRIFLTVFSLYFSQGEVNRLHCPMLFEFINKVLLWECLHTPFPLHQEIKPLLKVNFEWQFPMFKGARVARKNFFIRVRKTYSNLIRVKTIRDLRASFLWFTLGSILQHFGAGFLTLVICY